jgi:hypothetical protein
MGDQREAPILEEIRARFREIVEEHDLVNLPVRPGRIGPASGEQTPPLPRSLQRPVGIPGSGAARPPLSGSPQAESA